MCFTLAFITFMGLTIGTIQLGYSQRFGEIFTLGIVYNPQTL